MKEYNRNKIIDNNLCLNDKDYVATGTWYSKGSNSEFYDILRLWFFFLEFNFKVEIYIGWQPYF